MAIVYIYLLVFLGHVLATSYFYISGMHDHFFNYLYNITLTFFMLVPMVYSTVYIFRYPSLKKILIPLIISNLFFALALYIWFYYNVTGQEIPYPSIADLFFLLYYPANLISLFYLAKESGIKWNFSTIFSGLSVFIAVSVISLAFLTNLSMDFSAPLLVIFLNLIYPILDALLVAVSLTILRSQSITGYKYIFLYVFGYIAIALADTIFATQTNSGYYWNGNLVDLLYGTAHMFVALGTTFLPAFTSKLISTSTVSSNT